MIDPNLLELIDNFFAVAVYWSARLKASTEATWVHSPTFI